VSFGGRPTNDLRPAPGERLYRALLRLYPRSFRARYGEAMVEFYRDRWRAEAHLGVARQIWQEILVDVVRTAALERGMSLIRALRRPRSPTMARSPFTSQEQPMGTFVQDLRYALRGMAHRPGFTAVVVATLALGIGANAAIFSVVNGVLIRPLPFENPDGIAYFRHEDPYWSVSEPEFMDYRRDVKAFTRLAAFSPTDANLTGDVGEPERIAVARVSDQFFEVLGVRPALGRTFTPDEEKRGGPPVVVISHGFWQRRFAGDSAAVGKQIVMNDRARTVVGVLAPGAEYPSAEYSVWSPKRLNYDTLWERNNHYLTVIGRLAPGATAEQASSEVRALAQRMSRDFPAMYPADKPLVTSVMPLLNYTVAEVRPYLVTLFGAVLFVLLIACVNVANLQLARGEARRKELAIRSAMGATGLRVARQAFAESLLLAVIGGAAGVGLAVFAVRLLRSVVPANVPRADGIAMNLPVMLFALGITLITGFLFGMIPAMRSARSDAADTLKEGGKTSSMRGLGRLRSALVVSEVALSVVTLAGAGLMLRSLWNLQATNLGFNPDNVLAVSVATPVSYKPEQAQALYRRLTAEARALPGVVNAAAVEDLPILECCSGWSILIDNNPMVSVADAPAATPAKVTPGYFDVMRVGLVRGRVFAESDDENAPVVAIVNETMARTLWPGKDAVGGTVKMLNETSPRATVVGVVRDERVAGLVQPAPAIMYFPAAQAGKSAYYSPTWMWVVVRTTGDPAAIAPAVHNIIRRAEPLAAVARVQPMNQIVAASVSSRRFATALIAGFAVVALLLAGIGIYGVIAYSVSQREFEIGLRLALGATPRTVVRQILGEGLRTALIGAAVGLAVALATMRLLRAMFVEVSIADPLTLASVMALLVVVAMAASWIPALRASAVDPLGAMK